MTRIPTHKVIEIDLDYLTIDKAIALLEKYKECKGAILDVDLEWPEDNPDEEPRPVITVLIPL